MIRGIAIPVLSILALSACPVLGQPATFEVASVKSSKLAGEASRRERIESPPGSLIMSNVRFTRVMQWAYRVQDYQITGPGWINDERFDIVAKAATPVPENQLRIMLQELLAERFKLALHRQTKEMQAYVVTIGKEGHKLTESTTEGPMDVKPTGMFRATVLRADLDEVASMLSTPLQTPVLNLTGLKGRYDFSADLAEHVTPELLNTKRPGPEMIQDMIAIAISAMRKQLGLNVELRKVPVELLVIDHAEKAPTEN
jgi:uncharacterized protein (TIGR03435 family)